MGKALAISITIILLVLIGVVFAAWWRKRDDRTRFIGDLSGEQEQRLRELNQAAADIFRQLGPSYDIVDTDLLSDRSQAMVNAWLKENYELRKEIGNA